MKFFKLVMTVLQKIYATGKVFGKICLKTIRDTFFFSICGLQSVERHGDSKFWSGDDIQQKGKVQTYGFAGIPPSPPPVPSISGTPWSPHKENPEEGACSVYCNNFEKSQWKYLFLKQQIYSM